MSVLELTIILVTVSLSAFAQLALKVGVSSPAMESAMKSGGMELFTSTITSPLIWVGLTIYGLSVVMWLWVLSKVELSVAYPFVGVSFLLTMVFGVFLLNEAVTPTRIFGTIFIVMGCVMVARTA